MGRSDKRRRGTAVQGTDLEWPQAGRQQPEALPEVAPESPDEVIRVVDKGQGDKKPPDVDESTRLVVVDWLPGRGRLATRARTTRYANSC